MGLRYEHASRERIRISKAFFDVMWSVTLEELLTDTPWVEDPADPEFTASAARITAASSAHASEAAEWIGYGLVGTFIDWQIVSRRTVYRAP